MLYPFYISRHTCFTDSLVISNKKFSGRLFTYNRKNDVLIKNGSMKRIYFDISYYMQRMRILTQDSCIVINTPIASQMHAISISFYVL